MKKEYVTPTLESECFISNEYIAACWKVWCNVPFGYGYYEKNDVPGYQEGQDEQICTLSSGCGEPHEAKGIDASGPSANAMWQPTDWRGRADGAPYEVFHWELPKHSWTDTGHHFSKVSDAKWEKNPNASN